MLGLRVIQTWPTWLALSTFPALVVILTLALLPLVKGGVVGAFWSLGIVRDPD